MSVELSAEVFALDDVTPYERLVLLAFADSARRGSRHASPGLDVLMWATGLHRSRIYEVTAALTNPSRRGGPLLSRVEAGHRGRRAVYELRTKDRGSPHPDAKSSRDTGPKIVGTRPARPDPVDPGRVRPTPRKGPGSPPTRPVRTDPSRYYLPEQHLPPPPEPIRRRRTKTSST